MAFVLTQRSRHLAVPIVATGSTPVMMRPDRFIAANPFLTVAAGGPLRGRLRRPAVPPPPPS